MWRYRPEIHHSWYLPIHEISNQFAFLSNISNFSALRKEARAGPLVAAKRGPQFTGAQDRQGGQSRRGQRDFGQDDSIGGEDGTAEYNFAYEVNSDEGAQFSQQEEASGGVITGEYRVNLPDGRVQIVR